MAQFIPNPGGSGGSGGGAPVDARYVTTTTNGTLTQERVLTGTANQVTLTDNGAGSTLVLSLPQDIGVASSVTHGNMTLATGGALRTATSAGNTLLLQAYDVDGTSYTTFGTLTANNTPTFDLSTAVTMGGAAIYRVGGTDVSLADGGTGASLADPNADRILFWDDSAGSIDWLQLGTNLSITGTTINAAGGGGGGISGPGSSTDNAHVRWDGTSGTAVQDGRWVEDDGGNMVITQAAQTTTATRGLTWNFANHVTLTNTESMDVQFSAHTVDFATGTLATQRAFYVGATTYTSAGAKTITDAYTMYLEAPTAGTNVTITNAYSLGLAGRLLMSGTNRIVCTSAFTIQSTGSNTTMLGGLSVGNSGSDLIANTQQARTAGNIFAALNNNSAKMAVAFHGGISGTPGSATSGTTVFGLAIAPTTISSQAVSTEISMISVAAFTRTWLTGGITTQREYLFNAPTYAFAGSSTITAAATLAVTGAPIAGTNATITTAYALWVQGGVSRFDGKISFDSTITPPGTTGARTINKPAGTVNFAVGATTLVVTNSLATTASFIFVTQESNDTTALIKDVEKANGSFTIRLQAAATAETPVSFLVIN